MPDPRRAIVSFTCLAALLAAGCGSPRPSTPAYAVPEQIPAKRPSAPETAHVEPEPVGPLTLEAAVARALERSGEVAALRWSAFAARQETYADVQYRDPQLRGRYAEDELDELGTRMDAEPGLAPSDVSRAQTGRSFGVGLRLYPRNPLVTYWMKHAGHTAARAAEELVREAQWDVASEVRRLFAYVQYLEADYALINRHEETCRRLVAQARARHAQGQMVGQEMYRLLRRGVETGGASSRLRQDLRFNRRRLAALLDVSPGELVLLPLEDDLGATLARSHPEELLQAALAQRPDLAVLTYTTDAARHNLRSARSERMPWIEYLQGSYGESDADEVSGTRNSLGGGSETRTELEGEEWRIDTAITLPLFSWASKRPRQSKALLEAALQYEADLRGAIEGEVRAALEDARYVEATGPASMEEGKVLLDEARELAAVLEQDMSGMPDELLELDEDILRIERVHLRHRYDAQAARLRLLEVMGVVD